METDVRDLKARVVTVEYTSQNLSYPAQECYKECYTTSVNCCLYSVSYSLKTWGQESAVIYTCMRSDFVCMPLDAPDYYFFFVWKVPELDFPWPPS